MSSPTTYSQDMSRKSTYCDTCVDWTPEFPYNDLPLLPPAAEIETTAVLKACVRARVALASLEGASRLIPNPTILVGTLPLLEAQASTEIENIVTTSDELFRHLASESAADPATKEALRYRHALLEAAAGLTQRPITTRTAEEICTRLRGVDMRVRRVPGIRLANAVTGEVVYSPPEGEAHLRSLLGNWEQFLYREDGLDPLVRLAVVHYQFEAIHPFTDGNGRTGRIINSLLLVQSELLSDPILYLSRHILRTRAEYYRRLIAVTRDGDWESWILYMLEAIAITADWTSARIREVRELMAQTTELVRTRLPNLYSHELVNLLFEQPYCRIRNVVEAGVAGRQAASRYLKAIAAAGVLEERPSGREVLFVNQRLLWLLVG